MGLPKAADYFSPGWDILSFSRAHVILLSLVLVVITGALYFPVHNYPFVAYDDAGYVTRNLHVKYGLDWGTVKWAFTTFYASNWHPLTWISHALDSQLFSFRASRHHEMNVLLHAMNAVLLFWVLAQATGYLGRSFMVAALFAVHPINVESVAWVAERKNVLSMLFLLLALMAYDWYVSKPQVPRYIVVLMLYALGLMAKPQILTFPFLLLLWDYWPLGRLYPQEPGARLGTVKAAMSARNLRWLVLEKVPLFVLCAASAVVTVKAQKAGGALDPLVSYGLTTRCENAIIAYVRYLGKAVWPSHLTVLYPYPGTGIRAWQAYAALSLLVIVSVLLLKWRHRRYLLVGWFWFLGTLVPMIGLVQVGDQAMADRYAYLPFVGLFIMLCWGVGEWARQQRFSTAVLAFLSVAALLELAILTHRQLGYWKDDVSMWSHALQVTSRNWIAEESLGKLLMDRGQLEEAIPHIRAAAEIYPLHPVSYLYIGFYEQQKGDLRNAIEQYRKVIDLTQDTVKQAEFGAIRVNAFENMGYAYRDLGDYGHANECFEAAQALRAQ